MNFDFEQDIILENDRSRLEPLTEEHYERLVSIAVTHPDLLQYSSGAFAGKEGFKAYMGRALVMRALEERYPFAIFDKQLGQYAGSTSFASISNQHQRLEIGYTWLAPAFQRTGLNRNNKDLMLNYAFETLGAVRVEFKADALNVASRKAMEALGAVYEGTLRSHMQMAGDKRRDTVYYSILRNEWAAQ